jgi:uncharacterized MAPEG superfamily protein
MDLFGNPAMRWFALTYLLLVVKILAVGWITSFYRLRYRVYATPEDYALQGISVPASPPVGQEQIERARRAHQNDLENILPYFAVGFFFALTEPSLPVARFLYVTFFLARVLHTVFYLAALQPWRSLAFLVAQAALVVMLVLAFLRIAA